MPRHNINKINPSSSTIEEYKKLQPHPDRISGGLRLKEKFHKRPEPGKPLVSIITIVLNNNKTLKQTIESVLEQTYENIEYIVIDGGSTDGTLDILRKYDDKISYWQSEPDKGVSDAFNKGVAASKGDIIGLINSDDWLSVDQIEQGVNALNKTSADFVFGDIIFHNSSGIPKFRIHGNPYYADKISSKMPDLCHPTVLVRRNAYERVGLFDINYHYAMDYEWLLRLHKHGGIGLYFKEIIAHMRLLGLSDRFYTKAYQEVRDIAVYYGQPRWLAHYLYIFRVIKGFTRHALEKTAPAFLYHWMRKVVNQRYSSQA